MGNKIPRWQRKSHGQIARQIRNRGYDLAAEQLLQDQLQFHGGVLLTLMRCAHGLTIQEAAQDYGVDADTWQLWESTPHTFPKDFITALADRLSHPFLPPTLQPLWEQQVTALVELLQPKDILRTNPEELPGINLRDPNLRFAWIKCFLFDFWDCNPFDTYATDIAEQFFEPTCQSLNFQTLPIDNANAFLWIVWMVITWGQLVGVTDGLELLIQDFDDIDGPNPVNSLVGFTHWRNYLSEVVQSNHRWAK